MARRDRRSEIMLAAEKLFTSRRFHEVTLDDVIRHARVGKGTVYRYFRDKDDLFLQTAMNGFEELCGVLEGTRPSGAPFDRELLDACGQISAFFRRRRSLFRMMQSEESRMHWRKGELRRRWIVQRKRLASAVAEVIRRGVREGGIRKDVSAEVLAGLLLGMLRAHVRELAEDLDESRSLNIIVELFLNGAVAPAGRRRSGKRAASPGRGSGDGR